MSPSVQSTIAGSSLRRSQDRRHDEIVRLEERIEELRAKPIADLQQAPENVCLLGDCVAKWAAFPAKLVRRFLTSFRAADEELQQRICSNA
jgi:hypothetical protein